MALKEGGTPLAYRRLTEAELQTFVEEWSAHEIWRAYAAYAADIYGVAAERVEVVAGSEYNDEFSYLVIEDVRVYDAQSRQLDPDTSTDWWLTKLADRAAEARSEYYLDDEDAREDWLSDTIGERQAVLPVLAGGYDTYLLSKPPHRSHRALFVPE